MEYMARFCNDMIVMAHAKVLMQGSAKEVFSRADELCQVGLDVPEITTLCAMLRERGIPVEEGIYTVEDALAAVSRLLLEKGGHNS
jgi:aryl carrier-like protein